MGHPGSFGHSHIRSKALDPAGSPVAKDVSASAALGVRGIHLPCPHTAREASAVAAALGMGKVATSGQEAKAWGFLRDSDSISMNGDRLIQDAKQEVLNLDASGYVQPVERTDILALGESAQAARYSAENAAR
jgi:hypothetical protein